jgi:hypothetical protein
MRMLTGLLPVSNVIIAAVCRRVDERPRGRLDDGDAAAAEIVQEKIAHELAVIDVEFVRYEERVSHPFRVAFDRGGYSYDGLEDGYLGATASLRHR